MNTAAERFCPGRYFSVEAASRPLAVSLASLALLTLPWVNINSGPWHLDEPRGWMDWMHACRAALPFAAILLSFMFMQARGGWAGYGWASPFRLLLVFGCVALGASAFSPRPWYAFYWGITFLAAFLVFSAGMGRRDSLGHASQLLVATWVIVSIFAIVIAVLFRDVMTFETQGGHLTGYDIEGKTGEIAGMAMSRSSGVARFAAVPGIVAFAMLFYGRSKWRFLWLLPFGLFATLIIAMQSRGGLFGFVAALGFVFVLHKGRVFWIILMVAVSGLAVTVDETLPQKVSDYVHRGQDEESFRSMTGRTRPWANAVNAFWDAPLIGRGQWADRFVIGEHVHNAPLQALLSAGAVGVVPYLASWIAGWHFFIRVMRRWRHLPGRHRILLIQAGSVLTFFTVRSIPETTTASVAVNLLVMIPVFAYLEILDHELSSERWQPATGGAPFSAARGSRAAIARDGAV